MSSSSKDISALVVDTTFDDVQRAHNMSRMRAFNEARTSKTNLVITSQYREWSEKLEEAIQAEMDAVESRLEQTSAMAEMSEAQYGDDLADLQAEYREAKDSYDTLQALSRNSTASKAKNKAWKDARMKDLSGNMKGIDKRIREFNETHRKESRKYGVESRKQKSEWNSKKRVLDDTQVITDMFRAVERLYDPEPEPERPAGGVLGYVKKALGFAKK